MARKLVAATLLLPCLAFGFLVTNRKQHHHGICDFHLFMSSLNPNIVLEMDPFRVLTVASNPQSTNNITRFYSSTSSTMLTWNGLGVWKSALLRGRLPVKKDFPYYPEQVWPSHPSLYQALCSVLVELQLPRFVLRHPDAITVVLMALHRKVNEFEERMSLKEEEDRIAEHGVGEIETKEETPGEEETAFVCIVSDEYNQLDPDTLANEIANDLLEEFRPVLQGVEGMDSLFGAKHGLLGTLQGFGWQDGIWQHSGWSVVPVLQKQLAKMPELRHLVQRLGRRPTAELSGRLHKFPPRRFSTQGSLGVELDPRQRTSVQGLTKTNRFSEMLPTEAVLLKGNSTALRRLFLAKFAEAKLLSYELTGWSDISSIPSQISRRERLPTTSSGPILVCLDTSWSMSGIREQLSKAVVLACLMMARDRLVQIVAFSSTNNVMEMTPITANKEGITRLLDFLSHSFSGGGTDVTGALRYALQELRRNDNAKGITAAADIMLVTDGEIPSLEDTKLKREMATMQQEYGLQIHGLLVGDLESAIALEEICTETHYFLVHYERDILMHRQAP